MTIKLMLPGFVAAREMLLPSEAAAIEAQFKELPSEAVAIEAQFKELPPAPVVQPPKHANAWRRWRPPRRQPTPGETTTEAPGASPPGARSGASRPYRHIRR